MTASGTALSREEARAQLRQGNFQGHAPRRASRQTNDEAVEAQLQELREQAVFWIGQHSSPENAQYLRQLFERTRSDELRGKIMFSLSQMREIFAKQLQQGKVPEQPAQQVPAL